MSEFKIDEFSKCNKCNKNGVMKKDGNHYRLDLNCKCGGRFVTDWLKALNSK